MAEQWTTVTNPDGSTTTTVTGRTPIAPETKRGKWWWLGNVDDPQPPADYMPDKPEWQRQLMWNARNPLHNLTNYMIGVGDQNYSVTQTKVDDNWTKSVITLDSGRKLTGWQYKKGNVVAYYGWQPDGKFGAKFNIQNSPIQGV